MSAIQLTAEHLRQAKFAPDPPSDDNDDNDNDLADVLWKVIHDLLVLAWCDGGRLSRPADRLPLLHSESGASGMGRGGAGRRFVIARLADLGFVLDPIDRDDEPHAAPAASVSPQRLLVALGWILASGGLLDTLADRWCAGAEAGQPASMARLPPSLLDHPKVLGAAARDRASYFSRWNADVANAAGMSLSTPTSTGKWGGVNWCARV